MGKGGVRQAGVVVGLQMLSWPLPKPSPLAWISALIPWSIGPTLFPFAVSSGGLPVGIQLVGRPWEEELLLDTAARLEEVRGPFPSPPGIM